MLPTSQPDSVQWGNYCIGPFNLNLLILICGQQVYTQMAWWAISTKLYWERRDANTTWTISLQLHGLKDWEHSCSCKLLSSVAQIKNKLPNLLYNLFLLFYCINYLVRRRWRCFGLLNSAFYVLGGVVSDTYLSTAEIYRKQGDNTSAIINYSSAIQCCPTDDDIYFRRAEMYFEENQLLLAMDDYAKVS